MSSAILYLAIVAIWAGVLIPRWLRRDSLRGAVAGHETPVVPEDDLEDTEIAAAVADNADTTVAERDERDLPPLPLTADESRQRMLTARRRLLGMLVVLEVAAVGLAVLALAAVWVIIPPTLMLAGYMLLLREAAKADRERAVWEADMAARAAQTAQAKARRAARARAAERAAAATAAQAAAEAAAAAARFAAAPVADDYLAGGRDFAPGLAGKYTASHEDYVFPERHLRAVGD
jgi:hypothetical protein